MIEPIAAHIGVAVSGADLDAVADLMRAYAASLDVDLAYQDFEAELASLPGKYASPTGVLLIARSAERGDPVGCVALRPLNVASGCCEMKRLYVAPEGRGSGLGRRLVEAVIAEARRLGYREMRLDTLPSMESAKGIYRVLGFDETGPYYDSPVEGTTFMCLGLAGAQS
ncbi:MAG: GNAT family N-acetyltransferase [Hyphomicrobiaceae bacterium]